MHARSLRLLTLFMVACAPPVEGPVARSVGAAARAAAVPGDLMLAIGVVEGGVRLPAQRVVDGDDHVPVAGVLELRRGRLDTLALGARLAGVAEDALRADTDLGTRAGALVLAQLGRERGADAARLGSWRAAVATLSGLRDDDAAAYADQVFALLRAGGSFAARDGERIIVPAHPELPAPAAATAAAPARKRDAAEYPGAIWFDTSCTGKCTPGRPDGEAAVDTIVIHDTEGGWNASVATLQFDPGKSVHYIVDADGARVGQFIHEGDTGYHAGNWVYNMHSIGIEHVGFVGTPYDPRLYAASRALVESIRRRWDVPLDRTHIIGHYQVPNGHMIAEESPPCTDALAACETDPRYGGVSRHTDPGVTWQWCQYMNTLGGSCACNDTDSTWTCATDGTEAARCVNGQVELLACTQGCEAAATGGGDDDCRGATAVPDAAPVPDAAIVEHTDEGCVDAAGRRGARPAAWAAFAALALLAVRKRRR